MSVAKYQAYRNLNKPGYFSIKYRGLVIDYSQSMVMHDCSFFVSQAGRRKVIANRRKGVHAWVSGLSYSHLDPSTNISLDTKYEEVWYSPYFLENFMGISTGKTYSVAKSVYFYNNKCYVKKNELSP